MRGQSAQTGSRMWELFSVTQMLYENRIGSVFSCVVSNQKHDKKTSLYLSVLVSFTVLALVQTNKLY